MSKTERGRVQHSPSELEAHLVASITDAIDILVKIGRPLAVLEMAAYCTDAVRSEVVGEN